MEANTRQVGAAVLVAVMAATGCTILAPVGTAIGIQKHNAGLDPGDGCREPTPTTPAEQAAADARVATCQEQRRDAVVLATAAEDLHTRARLFGKVPDCTSLVAAAAVLRETGPVHCRQPTGQPVSYGWVVLPVALGLVFDLIALPILLLVAGPRLSPGGG